jgi:hypothetical protein
MSKAENCAQLTRSILKALVIIPNEQTKDYGSLLAIARHEAKKREKASENPPIRALKFIPELHVYVALYEAQATQKPEVKKHSG